MRFLPFGGARQAQSGDDAFASRSQIVGKLEITADGLTKDFGGIRAVDDLSFEIQPRRVVGLLGPNGSGKTATMRMLLGLVAPTSGRATIGGRAFVDLHEPAHQVGVVLETRPFHGGRTLTRPSAGPRHRGTHRAPTGRRGARTRRPRRRGRPARRHVLARPAPTPRAGRRAARRPAGTHPRRAPRRPGSRRHPLAARPLAQPRDGGTHHRPVQPRAGRSRPNRRRGPHPRSRPPARAPLTRRDGIARRRLPRAHHPRPGPDMTALISAESLRLRTLRSPRYVALGILALVALNAAPIMNGAPSTPGEVADWVRGLALLAVLMPAAYAANNIGDAFKRGSVAMTYHVHPQRDRVTAAHAIAYAGAGLVIAGTAVALALGIVLAVADADHV